jgi:hypothetical protein
MTYLMVWSCHEKFSNKTDDTLSLNFCRPLPLKDFSLSLSSFFKIERMKNN